MATDRGGRKSCTMHSFLESCGYASMYIFDRLIGVGPGMVS